MIFHADPTPCQLARRMDEKDLVRLSEHNVNIYSIWLDGGHKTFSDHPDWQMDQWEIQDFKDWAGGRQSWACSKDKNLLLCFFFLKNTWKWKKLDQGVRIPSAPWIRQCGWLQKVFCHHPSILYGHEKPFTTIQTLKRIVKLMQITSVYLPTLRDYEAPNIGSSDMQQAMVTM